MNMDESGRGDHVDEADVVESLLTLRRMPSSSTGAERVLHIAAPDQPEPARPAGELMQPDGAAGLTSSNGRDISLQHLHASNTASGVSSRPNSGTGLAALTQRPNSFTGKKRKPTGADDMTAAPGPRVPPFRHGDERQLAAAPAAEAAADVADAAARHLHKQLQAAPGLPTWSHGDAPFAVDGYGPSLRVASEPLLNGGQRLPEAVLAQLGLGALGVASGDQAAVDRLRALVLRPNGNSSSPPSAKRPHVGSQPAGSGGPSPQQDAGGGSGVGQAQGSAGGTLGRPQSAAGGQGYDASGGGAAPQAAQQSRWQQQQQQQGQQQQGQQQQGQQQQGQQQQGQQQGQHRQSGRLERADGAGGANASRPPLSPSRLAQASDPSSDPGSASDWSGGRRALEQAANRPADAAATGRGGQAAEAVSSAGRGAAAVGSMEYVGEAEDGALPGGPGQGPEGGGRTGSVISLLHMLAIQQQAKQQQQQQQQQEVPERQQPAAPRPPPQPTQRQQQQQQHQPVQRGLGRHDQLDVNGVEIKTESQGPHYSSDHDSGMIGSFPRRSLTVPPLQPPQQGQQPNGQTHHQKHLTQQQQQPHRAQQPAMRHDGPVGQGFAAAGSGAGSGAGLCRQQSYSSKERTAAAAVAAALAGGADPMQVDSSPAAHEGPDARPDRTQASLAMIERKLLLQEERLVYELKQVRLMQRLLQVQQMKHMVREAMRSKQLDSSTGGGGGSEAEAPEARQEPGPLLAGGMTAMEGAGPADGLSLSGAGVLPGAAPAAAAAVCYPSNGLAAALLAATSAAAGAPQGAAELLEAEVAAQLRAGGLAAGTAPEQAELLRQLLRMEQGLPPRAYPAQAEQQQQLQQQQQSQKHKAQMPLPPPQQQRLSRPVMAPAGGLAAQGSGARQVADGAAAGGAQQARAGHPAGGSDGAATGADGGGGPRHAGQLLSFMAAMATEPQGEGRPQGVAPLGPRQAGRREPEGPADGGQVAAAVQGAQGSARSLEALRLVELLGRPGVMKQLGHLLPLHDLPDEGLPQLRQDLAQRLQMEEQHLQQLQQLQHH